MQFLYVPLGDAQLPVLTLPDGKTINIPLFEIACKPLLRIEDLRRGIDPGVLVEDALTQAQEAIAAQLWANCQELERSKPDAPYLAILVRTEPHALAADQPPRPIYDPPAEYDEELDEMVVPEGAVKVGETPGYLGWVFQMTIGLSLLDELPEGYRSADAVDECPFYAIQFDLSSVLELIKTPKGRAKLAQQLGETLRLGGKKPETLHRNITTLVARNAARLRRQHENRPPV